MKTFRKYKRSISLFLTVLFMFFSTGCNNVYEIEVKKGAFEEYPSSLWISESNYHFVHTETGVKEVKSVYFDSKTSELRGTVLGEYDLNWNPLYQKVKRDGRPTGFSGKDVKWANQLHVHTNEIQINEDSTFVIAKDQITKTEKLYYNKYLSEKRKKAIGIGLGIGLGIAGTGLLVFGIIAITAAACNCPHVYIYNGQDFEMQTALFAGSIHSSLERRDYFLIQNYHLKEGLKMQIKNEEKKKETQYLNDVKLQAAYHSEGVQLRLDRNGQLHTIVNAISPLKAWSIKNFDVLPNIISIDHQTVNFTMNSDKSDLNQVFMNFYRPKGAVEAKLLLNARNTIWSGYVANEFYQLYGEEQKKVEKRFDKTSGEHKLKWQKDQGLLLSVYIKRNGKWIFEDYLDLTGTGGAREFVLPIKLDQINGDRIEIKLVSGFNLWELDYAAIDFSKNQEIEIEDIQVQSSLFNGNEIDLENIFSDESEYLVLENRGEVLDLIFEDANEKKGKKLTYVLSSKGYLKKHHDGSGEFNKSRLLQFMKKGEMSRFSKELMQVVQIIKR